MRALATGLLVLMTAVFLATRLAPAAWTWTAYVGAFAEAAMVGACADWFAVTALFRRPLGLPIPHTAIIPRNKDRIGEALGEFIAGNFLTPSVLERRLGRLEPARRVAAWLSDPESSETLARRCAAILPHLFQPSGEWRTLIVEVLRRAADSRPLTPLASRILGWLWAEPGVQAGLSRIVETLTAYLDGQETFIKDRMADGSWRWMPKWLDRILAEKFTHGLLGAVHDLGAPDHPWRADLARTIEDMLERLATDPEWIAQGEAIKARVLSDPGLPDRIESLLSALGSGPGGAGGEANPLNAKGLGIGDLAARGLRALGRWLSEDAAAREALDRWIRVAGLRVLSARRHEIGRYVAQVVSGWNAREVSDRLELQVGRDLQYIRINGALVGGVVGLVIFSLARWLP